MQREKHNITLAPKTWNTLKVLRRSRGKSISQIIEEAVDDMIKNRNYNPTYFKIMSSTEFCSDEENKELSKMLNSLTEDDLKIEEEYDL
jgi:hypothetical protein